MGPVKNIVGIIYINNRRSHRNVQISDHSILRSFPPEYSIGHRDQKGVPSGSANVGGCRLPLSGRSQKLRGGEEMGKF